MNYSPNVADKIPNILWQTYKSAAIPDQAKPLIKSWLDANPELAWYFMDDARCDQFMQDHFDPEFYNMYKSLPFGVMRSDVWRVAVVYVYGGIYADTDCHCHTPISNWINPEDRLVVAVEMDNGALANFTFAAVPRHPVLLTVLEHFLELYNSPGFLHQGDETPIQNFGQYGFSNGVLKYYNLNNPESMTLGGTTNYYNEVNTVKQDNTKFILKQDGKITNGYHRNNYISHVVASLSWKNYNSWRRDQRKLFLK